MGQSGEFRVSRYEVRGEGSASEPLLFGASTHVNGSQGLGLRVRVLTAGLTML